MKIFIVGAGKLGYKVASSLVSPDNYITLIDIDPKVIQKANDEMDVMAINANGLDFDLYEDSKMSTYDALLALTDNDEKNLVISSIAKKLGVKTTITRLRDPEYARDTELIKETFNVDFIINPDRLVSYEIFSYLMNKHEDLNQFFTGATIGMLEVKAETVSGLPGTKVLNAADHLGNLLIVSISRKGKIIIPKSHVSIEPDDTLYLLGKKPDIANLSSRIHSSNRGLGIKKVMIIGGGKTGYYLGERLSKSGIDVKIIEKDRNRCEYLSERLDDVLVLHADATETGLLVEENITGMDAVVTATGFDEDNIILALMAQQLGVREVIAKTSRSNYSALTDRIGVNYTINSVEISTGNILRLIKKNTFVSSSFFLRGQAEVMEVTIDHSMQICGERIMDIEFPEGVMVALIYRDTETVIPTGSTVIEKGDRMIIFSLLADVPDLERLLQTTRRRILRYNP